MKTIHLEGAMLDEVDVWFPNIPMVVKGVQCGVPGIKQYVQLYPNVSQCIPNQGCIFRLTCSYPELTKDHVLTSAYVNIFRTVTRNALNKSV